MTKGDVYMVVFLAMACVFFLVTSSMVEKLLAIGERRAAAFIFVVGISSAVALLVAIPFLFWE